MTSDGAQSLLRQLSPSAPAGRRLERYPVRVMLCAYMIKAHPEVVFNSVVRAAAVVWIVGRWLHAAIALACGGASGAGACTSHCALLQGSKGFRLDHDLTCVVSLRVLCPG